MNFLICDDETERAEEWKHDLEDNTANFEISVPSRKELQATITVLENRRKQVRDGNGNFGDRCLFDDADILVVDYDLLELEEGAGFLTGDKMAYLSRVFSTAGYIVVVNQFGLNEFDLSFKVDESSKADLNIGGVQLANPGLWRFPVDGGYRPWFWPVLDKAVEDLSKRITELEDGALDRPLLEYLGFSEDRTKFLSEAALTSLSRRGETSGGQSKRLNEISFRDFVIDCSDFLEVKDSKAIREADFDAQLCRIAASAVHKWLERRVIFEQDLLIDVPHLLERAPQLALGNNLSAESLSAAISFADEPQINPILAPHRFEKRCWASRPVYWWPSVESDDGISKLIRSDERQQDNAVFREDVSNFDQPEASRDFRTSSTGLYSGRYVSDGTTTDGITAGTALDAADVVYSPSVQFAR